MQFFTSQSSEIDSELTDKAAIYCVDPTISSFPLIIKNPNRWQVFVYHACLALIKEEQLSVDEVYFLLKTVQDYLLLSFGTKETKLSNQLNLLLSHPEQISRHLSRINFRCDMSLFLVDDLRYFTEFSDSLFESWLQNKIQDNPDLLQRLDSGRLKILNQLHEKLSIEPDSAIFLLDVLENECINGCLKM